VNQDQNKIVHTTRRIVTIAAYCAGIVLVALMLLTTADVVGRYFFNSPITGVFDVTHFAVLVMVFLGLAYCGFENGHVAIDVLYDKFNPKIAAILNQFVNLAGGVFFGIIGWQAMVQSVDVKEFKEASQLEAIPFYPFYYILAFGAALFAFVMVLRIFFPIEETSNHLTGDKE
jgi:TRAP-type transport system small permease protein